jgi:hypothetical protein
VESYALKLAKGERDRAGEEEVVSRVVLTALARACGLDAGPGEAPPPLDLGLRDSERLEVRYDDHAGPLRRLLDPPETGEVGTVVVHPDGRMAVGEPIQGCVLPGAFSPLHRGHVKLAEVASETLGAPVVFELSVTNVDKPPLQGREVRRRLRQFRGLGRVVLTRAPTFREKAELFPGCAFAIGWDTAMRLVHPRYYGGDHGAMVRALSRIRALGCSFLVAGRVEGGCFHTLEDVPIPPGFGELFRAVSEARFREDISSTELRATARGA